MTHKDYQATDVFQPASFPEYTYVTRRIENAHETYEAKLSRALKTKGMLSFITGASKSGKTVLCHKVVDKASLIEISGSHIKTIESFWNQIAEGLFLPTEIERSHGRNTETSLGGQIGAKGGIPFLSGDMKTGAQFKDGQTHTLKTKEQRSVRQMIDWIVKEDKVLVIDDFHYIDAEIQLAIARILKSEIFYGLKAIVISLPHRSDDAIRLNPDLNGRVRFIEIAHWTKDELAQIAYIGFELLKIKTEDGLIDLMAAESITSPQLMQQICLNLAFRYEDCKPEERYVQDANAVEEILQETTEDLQYEKITEKLLAGPLHGKNKRKKYLLKNGEEKDIYEVLFRVLAQDPPYSEINTEEILKRISDILADANLPRLTVSNTLDQVQKILEEAGCRFEYLEWRDGTLYVLDSLLLFYLRWNWRLKF